VVLTSPVEFPMYGKFKRTEISKEELLDFWNKILRRTDINIRTSVKVQGIDRGPDSIFTVATSKGQFRSRAVVLGLGRGGTPRKLGVKGEELPKVMYRLIEADHYFNKKILIVGGGDSAVEAAMGLAQQSGNEVVLSYRRSAFTRIKERNAHRIELCQSTGNLEVLFQSSPVEVKTHSVILDVKGQLREIPNDFVWIFAGGEAPNAFLKKIGVAFGMRDMTNEGSQEAKQEEIAEAELKSSVA
jgi:thioredoxin reductase (NADPH)